MGGNYIIAQPNCLDSSEMAITILYRPKKLGGGRRGGGGEPNYLDRSETGGRVGYILAHLGGGGGLDISTLGRGRVGY